MTFTDLTGRVFSKLTVISRVATVNGGAARWRCNCECGNTICTDGANLVAGRTKSCGCLMAALARVRMTTHGKRSSCEYNSWDGMIQRCTNKNHPKWENYGGAGVKVCARWRNSFAAFLQDMGKRPVRTTLDRYPNNRGNYTPANCRWATHEQQQNNKITCVYVTFRGKRMTVSQLARKIGMYPEKLHSRIRRGWPISKAIK